MNRTINTPCRNTKCWYCSWQFLSSLRTIKVGFRTMPVSDQPACFCPVCVFPRVPCSYRRRNLCSIPSRVESLDNRVPTIKLSMPPDDNAWAARASPEDVRTGHRTSRVSALLVSIPVARERPLLVSVWRHHVQPPVVKEKSIPRYRLHSCIDATFRIAGSPREAGRAGFRAQLPVISRHVL